MSRELWRYDEPRLPSFRASRAGLRHREIEDRLRRVDPRLRTLDAAGRLRLLRESVDKEGLRCPIVATVVPVEDAAVRGEWVLAPGADPQRRLLYIHGGGFSLGSPRSHRQITARLSAAARAAVFALDYRLQPEYSRRASIEDCRQAYLWVIHHGPVGTGTARNFMLAGDSAGGNFALGLLAWARDENLPAVDAAVALSPIVDVSLASPSIRKNLARDAMLGRALAPLLRMPAWLRTLAIRYHYGEDPRDPVISPIFGDLSRLPPLLIQASTAESLEDDARRYTNKAVAAGSPVTLQLWENMMHVWQAYAPELEEAREAFDHIAAFLRTHAGSALR